MIQLTLMWLALCGNMGSRDYMVRRDSTRVVISLYTHSPVTLPLYSYNSEGRQRCAVVWALYSSHREPLPRLHRWCLDSDDWWRLYTRVTGIKKEHANWLEMPDYDQEQSMVRILVNEMYARGIPRWWVSIHLWWLRYTDPFGES